MSIDLEIARAATLQPIAAIAAKAGIPDAALEPYGKYKAKISPGFVAEASARPPGALVLVTGINPTAAGEGKTTTTIGLGDALNALGTSAMIALREPSLGPCFGVKGGATGGGYAQVLPMEDINLHFTGDFHAITSANNLLSAMIDNHLYWGNELGMDPRRVSWRRAIDMNDRNLRDCVVGMGGATQGVVREDGFDITVASEVMAVFCLAKDLADLQARLGRIIVARRRDGTAVTAADVKADGSMAALLRDAFSPNLVQTIAGSPALVHGGPFANIAHGCNSVVATRLALGLADVVVTEAGFGADLGAEKFFDIKCRKAGLSPAATVIVATVRALKMHGGAAKEDLKVENVEVLKKGLANLGRHIENVKKFGVPIAVAINHFVSDTDAEVQAVIDYCRTHGVEAFRCTHWAEGGKGTEALAHHVAALADKGSAQFKPIYDEGVSLFDKVRTIAREIYRADDVVADKSVRDQLKAWEAAGYGKFPICMAKTQYSFSTDPNLKGAPVNHVVPVREVRLSAGAEFIVVICGDIMTMPGLPKVPSAEVIGLDEKGQIAGLF